MKEGRAWAPVGARRDRPRRRRPATRCTGSATTSSSRRSRWRTCTARASAPTAVWSRGSAPRSRSATAPVLHRRRAPDARLRVHRRRRRRVRARGTPRQRAASSTSAPGVLTTVRDLWAAMAGPGARRATPRAGRSRRPRARRRGADAGADPPRLVAVDLARRRACGRSIPDGATSSGGATRRPRSPCR